MRETKRYTRMNSTNDAHEFIDEKLERRARAWKDRASDGLPMIYASVAHL